MDVLHAIGNTSIVRLSRVVPPGCARILAKLEWENPTGSVKDRMAHAVISRAEAAGRLEDDARGAHAHLFELFDDEEAMPMIAQHRETAE